MNATVRQFRDFFVSLKLTVTLLVLGMLLVFFATLDQTNLGIWGIQQKWFHSFIVLQPMGGFPVPIFPGGYFIGGLLLINLVAAHVYRFTLKWRKSGIFLTHIGLILLLLGELFSGIWQEDFSMRLAPGEKKNYAESYHDHELAIIDTTNPEFDEVVVIPDKVLEKGEPIQHPKLPFRVVIKQYYPNSTFSSIPPAEPGKPPVNAPPSLATTGVGPRLIASALPMTYKMNERNFPTAFVELIGPEGSLGTWMTAPHPSSEPPHGPAIFPQTFQHGGRTWTVGMRATRSYKPFALTLLKFSHDRYPGTELPKNFSSRVRLTTPDGHDDREVLIYMNNPMRYSGLTFYQASFERGDQVSILQVVRNPSWLLPYISCSLMTLGLVIQFCIHLFAFANKRRRLATA